MGYLCIVITYPSVNGDLFLFLDLLIVFLILLKAFKQEYSSFVAYSLIRRGSDQCSLRETTYKTFAQQFFCQLDQIASQNINV
jgi:hypothetical protein